VEALSTGGAELGRGFADEMFRIHPEKVFSFGLDPPAS
jgi:hypothetical protein